MIGSESSQTSDYDILFFESQPTMAGTDGSQFLVDTTNGSLAMQFIRIRESDYTADFGTSDVFAVGNHDELGKTVQAVAGTTSIWAVTVWRGITHTVTAAQTMRHRFGFDYK